MTTSLAGNPVPATSAATSAARRVRRFTGCLYLFTAGIHVGLVAADAQFYRPFADQALVGFVRTGWREIFMADPVLWGLLVAVGEAALGVLLLSAGRAVQVGWVGVIACHALLMLFGVGFWLWALPVLAVLVPAAVRDWPGLAGPRPPRPPRASYQGVR